VFGLFAFLCVCVCVCVCVCQSRELLSSSGLRLDGRRWAELRSVIVQCGVISSAVSGVDGSCSYQQGNTLVLAAVFGPREVTAGMSGGSIGSDSGVDGSARVSVHVTHTAFAGSIRREQRRSDKRIAEMSSVIRQSVSAAILTHLFPNSSIHIALTVLADDGGLLPATLNAATLALLHAGIAMRDIPVAVSIACVPATHTSQPHTASHSPSSQPSTVLLDPSVSEVSAVGGQSGCLLQLGVGCCTDRIVFMLSGGRLPVLELTAMLSASQAACRAIHQRMKDELSRCSQSRGTLQHTPARVSVPLAAS